ncbi:MAG: R3H domain-containing nucleic acid-binding protein [bacterium]
MNQKKGFWSFLGASKAEEEGTVGAVTKSEEVVHDDVTTNTKDLGENQKKSAGKRRSDIDMDLPVTEEICCFCVASLENILQAAGFSGCVRLKEFSEHFIALDIFDAGADNGRLIGKQGNTVLALQILLRQFVLRKFRVSCKISVDVDGYKARQKTQFRSDVMSSAQKVLDGEPEVSLDPMNAPDRRAVHVMFEHHDQLTTESVGEGDQRYVVIKAR